MKIDIITLVDQAVDGFLRAQEKATKKIKAPYEMVKAIVRELHSKLCENHPADMEEGSMVYDEKMGGHKVSILGDWVFMPTLIEVFKEQQSCHFCDEPNMDESRNGVVATCRECFKNLCHEHSRTLVHDTGQKAPVPDKEQKKFVQGKILRDWTYCEECLAEKEKGEKEKLYEAPCHVCEEHFPKENCSNLTTNDGHFVVCGCKCWKALVDSYEEGK